MHNAGVCQVKERWYWTGSFSGFHTRGAPGLGVSHPANQRPPVDTKQYWQEQQTEEPSHMAQVIIGQSTTLIQIEISQHLWDGLLLYWNLWSPGGSCSIRINKSCSRNGGSLFVVLLNSFFFPVKAWHFTHNTILSTYYSVTILGTAYKTHR